MTILNGFMPFCYNNIRERKACITLMTIQCKMFNCKNEIPFKFEHLTVRQFLLVYFDVCITLRWTISAETCLKIIYHIYIKQTSFSVIDGAFFSNA